jgi:hypothetical protein
MTTDDIRAWMKALEERDVRIVALEKQVAALTARLDWKPWVLKQIEGLPPPNSAEALAVAPAWSAAQPDEPSVCKGYRFHVPEKPRSVRDLMVGNIAWNLAQGLQPAEELEYIRYVLSRLQTQQYRNAEAADWARHGKPSESAWAAACDVLHAHAAHVPPAFRPGNAGYPPGRRHR